MVPLRSQLSLVALVVGFLGNLQQRAPADTIPATVALASFDTAWTKIRDLHYDTLMNGVDWNAVRQELRPRAQVARTTTALRSVINSMLERLGQSHYRLIPAEVATTFGAEGAAAQTAAFTGELGIELRRLGGNIAVSRVDSGSNAFDAGVRPGWLLLSIGSLDVAAAVSALDTLAATRVRKEGWLKLVLRAQSAARGVPGQSVSVTLRTPAGETREHSLVFRPAPGELVRYSSLPPMMARVSWRRIPREAAGTRACIGVMSFNTWMPAIAHKIDSAVNELRQCGALVVDLRGNTGGVATMIGGVAGHFLQRADTLGTIRTRTATLRLTANPRLSTASGEHVQPFSGRVAVLVDEITASTSELFASALQGLGRARVFGDTTAGQALPATLHRLPNGDVLMLAVGDFHGVGGVRIEGTGVIPDQVHTRSSVDLLSGRDVVLEAALTWLASVPPETPRGK